MKFIFHSANFSDTLEPLTQVATFVYLLLSLANCAEKVRILFAVVEWDSLSGIRDYTHFEVL